MPARLSVGTGIIVDNINPDDTTPCVNIHVQVNNKDINLKNLSVPLIKCSENN